MESWAGSRRLGRDCDQKSCSCREPCCSFSSRRQRQSRRACISGSCIPLSAEPGVAFQYSKRSYLGFRSTIIHYFKNLLFSSIVPFLQLHGRRLAISAPGFAGGPTCFDCSRSDCDGSFITIQLFRPLMNCVGFVFKYNSIGSKIHNKLTEDLALCNLKKSKMDELNSYIGRYVYPRSDISHYH